MNNNGGLQVGIADDQAKDFDFEKTEMKYDSTGMFHWGPARNLEECILVSENKELGLSGAHRIIMSSWMTTPEIPNGVDCGIISTSKHTLSSFTSLSSLSIPNNHQSMVSRKSLHSGFYS